MIPPPHTHSCVFIMIWVYNGDHISSWVSSSVFTSSVMPIKHREKWSGQSWKQGETLSALRILFNLCTRWAPPPSLCHQPPERMPAQACILYLISLVLSLATILEGAASGWLPTVGRSVLSTRWNHQTGILILEPQDDLELWIMENENTLIYFLLLENKILLYTFKKWVFFVTHLKNISRTAFCILRYKSTLSFLLTPCSSTIFTWPSFVDIEIKIFH